jgi:ATP-dependent RNA helicase DHX57
VFFLTKAKFISALSQRGYLQPVCDTLRVLDQNVINYELATKLVTHVCTDMEPGAILIFMPGLAEISKLHESLGNNPTVRAATLNSQYLIALHSTLSTAEQKVIFEHPPAGTRKIVIATNIAETSITIDDVVSVCINSLCSVLKYPNTTQLLITITPRTHTHRRSTSSTPGSVKRTGTTRTRGCSCC